MSGKRKLILGVAPVRRDYFNNPVVQNNKRVILEEVEMLSKKWDFEVVDINGINDEGIMYNLSAAKEAAKLFKNAGVNALFVPHCNFGQEEAVYKLASILKVPTLVWGFRDGAPNEFQWRDTDTQCGLFATGKALYRGGIPFTYIENCNITDDVFEKDFLKFIQSARIVDALKNARIAQISVRPQPFMSVMVNESELLERFGIEVVPVPATTIVNSAKEYTKDKTKVSNIIEGYKKSGIDLSKMPDESINNMAGLELAIKGFAEENDCSAVVSECWNTFETSLFIRPCAVFGNLTDAGLPVCCENDVHGAVSMIVAQAANNWAEPTFLADLTQRHPENDNAELLWHCGPFPKSLRAFDSHGFINDGMGQWRLKDGELTLIRFDGCRNKYSLLSGISHTVEGPLTNGNYVWVEVDNWPRWEKKLVCGPYIHHTAVVYGNYVKAIKEACKYLDGIEFDEP